MLHKNLIAGEWVDGATTSPNINPSDTDDVVGEYAHADAAQTRAGDRRGQGGVPGLGAQPHRRSAPTCSTRSAREILARKDELGRCSRARRARRCPRASARSARAGQIFKFFAGEALRAGGRAARLGAPRHRRRDHARAARRRRPDHARGTSRSRSRPGRSRRRSPTAIAWCSSPPISCRAARWALAEIIAAPACRQGVFNLVMGRGSVVGEAIRQPSGRRRDQLHRLGRHRPRASPRPAPARMAKFQLEMGGKNPLVVLDDADLKIAVDCAVNGAFFSTGQRCTASSRLIVTEGIHDRFVDALVEATEGAGGRRRAEARRRRSARWSTRTSSSRT